jgi:DNA-binding transcriptional MocR family regulator
MLSCSSFFKTLAPGFCVSWVLPGKYSEQIIQHKRLASAATITFIQLAIANYLSSGSYQRHLGKLQQTFKQQVFLLREAVARYFPTGTRISDPQEGGCTMGAIASAGGYPVTDGAGNGRENQYRAGDDVYSRSSCKYQS